MFNSNAFKTSLMFLGIIIMVVTLKMFLAHDGIFLHATSTKDVLANIVCSFKNSCIY